MREIIPLEQNRFTITFAKAYAKQSPKFKPAGCRPFPYFRHATRATSICSESAEILRDAGKDQTRALRLRHAVLPTRVYIYITATRTAEPGAFRFARESVDTAHVVNAGGFFWVRRHRALGRLQTPCSRFSATASYVMLGLFAVMPLLVSRG